MTLLWRVDGCEAVDSSPYKPCSTTGANFRVVYRSSEGVMLERHLACFAHGLAEVDRHHAAAGMARCDLEGPIRD